MASVGITFLLENVYMATTLVMVKPYERLRLEQNLAGKEIMGYPVSQLAPMDAPSRTNIEVIKSRLLAERVVRTLRLHQKPPRPPAEGAWKERWASFKDGVAEALTSTRDYLQFGMVRHDPFEAAVTLVQRSCVLRPTKDTYLFDITCGSSDPREAAALANATAGVFLDYTTAINRQESGSVRAFLEGQLHEAGGRLTEARRQLTQFKDAQGTFALQDEYTNQLKTISGIETDLEKTEARLAGLRHEYTAAHPKVQSLEAEAARLRSALTKLRGERVALPDKERRLESARVAVKEAEDSYTVVSKALTETRIQEESRASDIRVVSPAVPPVYPARPIRIYYVTVGVVGALLVGALVVLFSESVWTRVRSRADVERMGLRVLATIPRVK